MPLSQRLRSFLERQHAEFTLTIHPKAFTAREVAAAEHLPPREVAKSVVFFGDAGYHLIVLPANRLVDLHDVRPALGLSQARLATEAELGTLFPDCELGAMPPLGQLYGLPVYFDDMLVGQPFIAFNGGTHQEVIHMRTSEFLRLTAPHIVSLARDPSPVHG